jgi:glycine/D-amino acid oxidase-like deaminating enzyme
MSKVIDTADVIIIGGGVAGLSTAMQLGRRGARVIVLDRGQLGSGSTGRAAGLLGQLRGTPEETRMLMDGVKIVQELEARAGVEIFVQTGSLRIAETPARAREITDLVAMGKALGFDIDRLSIDAVAKMLPYMKTDDLVEACYCPTDGYLQPAELVGAYVKVGRECGVTYRTATPVQAILSAGAQVRGVETPAGQIHAPVVVNAAGPWSYLIAAMVDTALPAAAIGHNYLTTRPDGDHPVDRQSPAIRDRHLRIYARAEGGGLIVGLYEAEPAEYDTERLDPDFDMSAMKEPLDSLHIALLLDAAQQRFPWITPRSKMTMTTGIMTFTPDAKPLCGTLAGTEGLYHCTGFSGHGIVESPTIGRVMADLILDGTTSYEIGAIRADRYLDKDGYRTRAEIKARCFEMAAGYYGKVEGRGAVTES